MLAFTAHIVVGLPTLAFSAHVIVGLPTLAFAAHVVVGLATLAFSAHIIVGLPTLAFAAHVVVGLATLAFSAHIVVGLPTLAFTAHVVVGLPTLAFGCPHHHGAAYACVWLPASSLGTIVVGLMARVWLPALSLGQFRRIRLWGEVLMWHVSVEDIGGGGSQLVSGGIRKPRTARTSHDKSRGPFSRRTDRPPTSWVPPRVAPSISPGRV